MPGNKSPHKIAAAKLDRYDQLIKSIPSLERKGVTMPYTSINGNMFTFLDPDGVMALRLGTEERENFIARHQTTLMKANGVVMKEYVRIPDSLWQDTRAMEQYLAASYEYVKTLKSKSSKK